MSTKRQILILAVAALIVLNLWRWWPENNIEDVLDNAESINISSSENIDLKVATILSSQNTRMKRDLFYMPAPKIIKQLPKENPKKPTEIQKKKVVSEAEISRQLADKELNKYRLVGIAKKRGRMRAFLHKGELSFIVSEGDKIESDYTVESVTSDSIVLVHSPTNTSKLISLSNK